MKAFSQYIACVLMSLSLAPPLVAQTVPDKPDPSDVKECYDRGGGDVQRKVLACHRVSVPLLKQLVEKKIEIPAPVVNVPAPVVNVPPPVVNVPPPVVNVPPPVVNVLPARRSLWITTGTNQMSPQQVKELCNKLGYNDGEQRAYAANVLMGMICFE